MYTPKTPEQVIDEVNKVDSEATQGLPDATMKIFDQLIVDNWRKRDNTAELKAAILKESGLFNDTMEIKKDIVKKVWSNQGWNVTVGHHTIKISQETFGKEAPPEPRNY